MQVFSTPVKLNSKNFQAKIHLYFLEENENFQM